MSSSQPTGGLQQPKEESLGIGDGFKLPQRRDLDRDPATRIIGSLAQGAFIEEQPGFLHPDGDHADSGRLIPDWQMPPDLLDTRCSGLPFRVTMDEEKIAGVKLQGCTDSFAKRTRRVAELPQVGPLAL
jgi:hypothetical protein